MGKLSKNQELFALSTQMRTRSRSRALEGGVQHYHLDARRRAIAVEAETESPESSMVRKN